MRQLTITVAESEYAFIRQLLKRQPGVQIAKSQRLPVPPQEPLKKPLTPEQQEWVDDLKQSLREAEAAMRGEIKLPTLAEHLAELRALRQQTPEPTNAD